MPINPRSPLALTGRVTNGVGNSTPSLITRTAPPCCATKIRPSIDTAIAVGSTRPLTTTVSVKPGRSVAAASVAGNSVAADSVAAATTAAVIRPDQDATALVLVIIHADLLFSFSDRPEERRG